MSGGWKQPRDTWAFSCIFCGKPTHYGPCNMAPERKPVTNADDIFGELEYAKKCVRAGDFDGALDAIVQAEKLWRAERDYWALIEVETNK